MNEEIEQEYERLIKEFKSAGINLEDAQEEYDNTFADLEEFKAKYREELDGN